MRAGPRHRPVTAATLAAAAALALAVAAPALADPAGLVDTRDGTLGPGFPTVGASLPFGMIQPGPDTATAGGYQDPVDYVGYSYQDPEIRGFSLTHFSGAGIQIGGDLPFMATTGAVSPDAAADASPYQHTTEAAGPGYYAVTLDRYQTRVELTGTLRAALMRFTFPAGSPGNVLAEVSQSVSGAHPGAVTVLGGRELEGWVKSDVGYRVYFDASFDHPFHTAGTWTGGGVRPGSLTASGSSVGAYASFDTAKSAVVTMRVGISYVDQAGARRNLAAELPPGRSFQQVRQAARGAWDARLSDVAVGGGSQAEQQTFYDNLYRSLMMPSILDDADGRYPGLDRRLHRVAPGHHQYTGLSLWDIYRSQVPLLALIEPEVTHDVLVSLITDAEQNHGVIPRWVQANVDRGIMAGDSGSAVLADGALMGLLTPAESRAALSLLVAQATKLPPVWPREHLDAYLRYGYIPNDVSGIGAAETEEYAIDDYAVAELSARLGNPAAAATLAARAAYWRHLVDPSTRFIRPRNKDGRWANPTAVGDPTGITGLAAPIFLPYNPALQDGYQEGTGWQYLWSVPHDPAGLAQAMGGQAVAVNRLDQFFSTALNSPSVPAVAAAHKYGGFFGVYFIGNQYTSVNEPDLWAPWFYDFYGQPWKAAKVARAEMTAYNQTVEGLPGNDDAGEMSAWYVLASLGLYHVAPGVDAWEISSPAFPSASVRVGSRPLEILAPGASAQRVYVDGLTLDAAPISRTFLTTCEVRGGGALRFSLGPAEGGPWGTRPGAAPPSETAPSPLVSECAARLLAASSRPAVPHRGHRHPHRARVRRAHARRPRVRRAFTGRARGRPT